VRAAWSADLTRERLAAVGDPAARARLGARTRPEFQKDILSRAPMEGYRRGSKEATATEHGSLRQEMRFSQSGESRVLG